MKSNKRRIIFSLAMLIMLIIFAYITANKNGWFNQTIKSNNDPLSNFAITDTAAIDKMIISKTTGEKVTLTKGKNNNWTVNEKYRARPESITLIMRTIYHTTIKSRVGAASRNNAIKNLAAFHRKVQFFKNGEWYKTWYVGNSTSDRLGTYMLLETPEDGKSDEPYIGEVTGFHGELDIRFYTEEDKWRYTGIFEYSNINEIKEIILTNGESPNEGFILQLNEMHKPVLMDTKGGKVARFDSLMAKAYFYGFKKIHYEHLARTLNYKSLDSLKLSTPLYSISVKSVAGETKKISVYRMKSKSGEVDLDGNQLPYNPERAYAILSTGEVAVIQYGVFDKLFRTLSNFVSLRSGAKVKP